MNSEKGSVDAALTKKYKIRIGEEQTMPSSK